MQNITYLCPDNSFLVLFTLTYSRLASLHTTFHTLDSQQQPHVHYSSTICIQGNLNNTIRTPTLSSPKRLLVNDCRLAAT